MQLLLGVGSYSHSATASIRWTASVLVDAFIAPTSSAPTLTHHKKRGPQCSLLEPQFGDLNVSDGVRSAVKRVRCHRKEALFPRMTLGKSQDCHCVWAAECLLDEASFGREQQDQKASC